MCKLVYTNYIYTMNAHADKTPENKTQAIANVASQKKDAHSPSFEFVDNRQGSVAQRKLQEAINNSPRIQQLKAQHEMVYNRIEGEKQELIVEDYEESLLPGQMKKSEFLGKLHQELYNAGAEEYKGTNLTVEGCPYINRWFLLYHNASSGHIDKALLKYVRASSPIESAEQLMALITDRARLGFKKQVETGEITELPGDITESTGKGIVPEPEMIQRKEREKGLKAVNLNAGPVVQLGCINKGDGGGGAGGGMAGGAAGPAPILAPAPLVAAGPPDAPVFNFLPWGAAVTVGYKGKETEYWNAVVLAGRPVWSGGVLGPGFYTTLTTNGALAAFYSHAAGGHTMEVGYIGGLAGLNIADIAQTDDYDPALHDVPGVDVVRVTDLTTGQLCFKNTAAVNLANFRFRPY